MIGPDLVRASATREEQLLSSRGLLVITRSTDGAPLAFGRDPEAIAQLARRIQPATGEWRAVVERRAR
jgi:hypothetical protein